jgi:hypothetical protein
LTDHLTGIAIHVKCGEDFTAKIEWFTEFGEPMPVTDWAKMEIRDDTSMLVLRLENTEYVSGDVTQRGYLRLLKSAGAVHMFIPWEVTKSIPPGVFIFDLFVGVDMAGLNNPSFELTDGLMRTSLVSGQAIFHPAVTTVP